MVKIDGAEYGLQYEPGESSTSLFGGNSNWRGPVWIPMNYLLIQSLLELYKYNGNSVISACPAGYDRLLNLDQIAEDISKSLISIFQSDANGNRPVHSNNMLYSKDPHFKNLLLFYEYFHGDTGRGIGASHQTGWTGLVAELIDRMHK